MLTRFDAEPGPRADDFTICIYCMAVLCFTDELQLREATLDELAALREEAPEQFALLQLLPDIVREMKEKSAQQREATGHRGTSRPKRKKF